PSPRSYRSASNNIAVLFCLPIAFHSNFTAWAVSLEPPSPLRYFSAAAKSAAPLSEGITFETGALGRSPGGAALPVAATPSSGDAPLVGCFGGFASVAECWDFWCASGLSCCVSDLLLTCPEGATSAGRRDEGTAPPDDSEPGKSWFRVPRPPLVGAAGADTAFAMLP